MPLVSVPFEVSPQQEPPQLAIALISFTVPENVTSARPAESLAERTQIVMIHSIHYSYGRVFDPFALPFFMPFFCIFFWFEQPMVWKDATMPPSQSSQTSIHSSSHLARGCSRGRFHLSQGRATKGLRFRYGCGSTITRKKCTKACRVLSLVSLIPIIL